jgi:hypothetical protein
MYFHLERFKNGHPAQTESGDYVKFVSVLSDNTPAKLIVEKRGVMENYYLNGTFHGSDNRCEEDL